MELDKRSQKEKKKCFDNWEEEERRSMDLIYVAPKKATELSLCSLPLSKQ